MKYKSLYMRKINLKHFIMQLEQQGINKNDVKVAIPDREIDDKIFKRIHKGTFKAFISHIRILWKHKNFFRILNLCVENDIFSRMIKQKKIKILVLQKLREKHKEDIEVLRYILKFYFLPLKEIILPNGKIYNIVSSQAFDELDELIADEFFIKSYEFLAEIFDIEVDEFKNWS